MTLLYIAYIAGSVAATIFIIVLLLLIRGDLIIIKENQFSKDVDPRAATKGTSEPTSIEVELLGSEPAPKASSIHNVDNFIIIRYPATSENDIAFDVFRFEKVDEAVYSEGFLQALRDYASSEKKYRAHDE